MNTDTLTLHTAKYAKDVLGFGGPVPLQIHLSAEGHIDSITALPNNEDTQYFNQARTLLHSWDGLTVTEALKQQVDVVSGATYSSRAIINGVQQTLKAYQEEKASATSASYLVPAAVGLGLAVAVVAAYLLRRKKKH